jgi:hypothetical protein
MITSSLLLTIANVVWTAVLYLFIGLGIELVVLLLCGLYLFNRYGALKPVFSAYAKYRTFKYWPYRMTLRSNPPIVWWMWWVWGPPMPPEPPRNIENEW